jgi:TPR repeat protein
MKLSIIIYIFMFSLIITFQGCKSKEEAAASKALNSAEQGAAIGQLKLAKMYAEGEGVEQSNIYAHMWVNAAVIQGLGNTADEFKNELEKKMLDSEILSAESLYVECKKKSYKSC